MTMQPTEKDRLHFAHMDAEWLTKNLQKIVTDSSNPLLLEIIHDMLPQAQAMANKLARLEALVAGQDTDA